MLRCSTIVFVSITASIAFAQVSLLEREGDVQLAAANLPRKQPTEVEFSLDKPSRVSIAVFDKTSNRLLRTLLAGEKLSSGTHRIDWDGMDNDGNPISKGAYQWRLLSSSSLTARYITTIGINPPGGEDPIPKKSWVGDHLGGGIVDVDSTGIYVGSPITEGGRMILKVNPSKDKILWSRPQFYQSGRLTKIATNEQHVFMIHPNGKLRRVNKDNGRVEKEWQNAIEKQAPEDIDANGNNVAVVYKEQGLVRWLSAEDGKSLGEAKIKNAGCLAAISKTALGEVFVGVGHDIYRVQPKSAQKVATLEGAITALDYDAKRKELWAVVNGHQVVRMDENMRVAQTYSDKPRELGPYDPTRFAGVADIAADFEGGFFIGEPARAPRRIAHIARDGSVLTEWFGGMSFYINGQFDPEDSTRLIGIAPEGSVNIYKIDFEKGTWNVEACYETGRLGDSIFPFTGAFRVIRRGGELYLYHREVPAVIRLDENLRKAIPVAYAGGVRNQGRSLIQFAGTGRDGFPKPWVKAAEHYWHNELAKVPKFFTWADSNGNGDFEPTEFKFYPNVKHMPQGGGDYFPNGDYVGKERLNNPNALIRIPVAQWEGPNQAAPRWDLTKQQSLGKVIANAHGFGSVRSLTIADDGSISAAYQAGVMIRGHGQYEGGGWPESAVKGCRLLKFDAQFRPLFSVGRQSKVGSEVNTGALYYPMKTTNGPNNSIVVNDQTKQPAQVWTHDGLYIGGVFDNRADDGLADAFYQVHGDDNQGCTVMTTPAGKTYWLMPYQGHNRLYEITGWNNWERQSGDVRLQARASKQEMDGAGLNATYKQQGKAALKVVEPPIYHEQFGAERHSGTLKVPYSVEWNGYLVPTLSDRYQFHTLIGKNEQFAIWVDGQQIHANGMKAEKRVDQSVDLVAGHKHLIHIEYINPDNRAELKLMWSSRVIDHQRIPAKHFYPREK